MSVISNVGAIKKTVVYIFSGEVHGEQLTSIHPLGTGFFVGVPHHERRGQAWLYLVTAKHLLKPNPDREEYRRELVLRVNLRNWSSSSDRPGAALARIPVLNEENSLLWAIHSNPAVDLAVGQFPPPPTFEFEAIPSPSFLTEEVFRRQGVAEGDEVIFPCFTPEIPQQRRNYPVVRFGRIALVLEEEIPTREGRAKFYFAECFPFGGNSGSPVLLRFGPTRRAGTIVVGQERYGLMGVIHGFMPVQAPVELRETEARAYLSVSQSMGIGLITPVDYLKDILYSETLRRQRGEID